MPASVPQGPPSLGGEATVGKNVKVVVEPSKCVLSGDCFKVCPRSAIVERDGKAFILQEKCDLDGLCIPACPRHAIRMVNAGEE